MNNTDFDLKNLPIEAQDPTISAEDFKYIPADKRIHEQKFQTKPTTFLKDCVKRFAKNKSSVVAAFILGFLLILSIIVPIIGNRYEIHNTKIKHGATISYLEPKLFEAGTGFWDGTKKLKDVPVDTTSSNKEDWLPGNYKDKPSAISNLVIQEESYTLSATEFGHGGYVAFGHSSHLKEESIYLSYQDKSPSNKEPIIDSFDFAGTYDVTSGEPAITTTYNNSLIIDNFEVYTADDLAKAGETTVTLPENFIQGKCALYLSFTKESYDEVHGYNIETVHNIPLTEYQESFKIDETSKIDIVEKFNEYYEEYNSTKDLQNRWTDKEVKNPFIQIRLLNANTDELQVNSCVLIKSINIKASTGNSKLNEFFGNLSFSDGNEVMTRESKLDYYWKNYGSNTTSSVSIYLARATLCSFTYDTYEATFGQMKKDLSLTELNVYIKTQKSLSFKCPFKIVDGKKVVDENSFECKILNSDKCPLAFPIQPEDVEMDPLSGVVLKVHATVLKYKTEEFGLTKMPKFIFGTDKAGKDLFIYTFEGLRNSLLIGVATTVICFLFGLLWGSVSGYFGGNVDLVMERFTDILSGIPWIVLMTLIMLKYGSNFFTFAIALCLTGWIGTAATTRTQFYRFRGREYVLASRTLGASHGRLIAKHILPNAMGTIITSAVLMVPSVIFSEATINFIFHDMDTSRASLGVILSDNQTEIQNHPFLLIVPSVVIALVMISFNLFGNGLRDAVNPSLKGEGE